MSTYTQICYHLVFCTKSRRKTLIKNNRDKLFYYLIGFINAKKCFIYQINGVEDHIHVLVEINPTISLSAFVKDFKLAASHFIRNEKLFPDFNGWQKGYGAFTVSHKSITYVANYIANQEEHHRKKSSRDEFIGFLRENDIVFEDRYIE